MKLTIAIPTHNGGSDLVRTVDSCHPKGLHDDEYEILVIDNASTDGSIEDIIKSSPPSLRIERNEKNIGRIGNWNKALELARGETILFLMVSDELDRNTDFANAIHLSLRKDSCAVHSYYADFGSGSKLVSTNPGSNSQSTMLSMKDSIESLGRIGGLPPLQLHLLRTSVLRNAGLKFEEKWPFLADVVFLTEYVSLFKEITYLKTPLVHWKLGNTRFTFSNQLSVFKEFPIVYEYLFEKYLFRRPNMVKMEGVLGAQALFLWLAYVFRGKKLEARKILSYCSRGKYGIIHSLCYLPMVTVCSYLQGRGKFGTFLTKTLKC